jgi:hypothetical protein
LATTTYEPLATVTASGGSATQLVMSSIPSTYTDLVLIVNDSRTAISNIYIQINGDTGSNYSLTYVSGSGSVAGSGRNSNMSTGYYFDAYGSSTTRGTGILNFMNYSNTTTYKSILSRYSNAGGEAIATIGLWRSTAAINSITIYLSGNSATFNTGTTFTLYGIANSNIGAPKATGGIITYDDTYFYHTFGASGTFTPKQSLTADILVVAGGGGGAKENGAGGGGAGGLLGFASQSLSATGYTVTVGSGGTGGTSVGNGGVGGDSQFGGLTLVKGGGYGGGGPGGNGGSGGGAYPGSNGGSPTSGQGNAGGNGVIPFASPYPSGGGGGAGAAGANGVGSQSGAGGVGSSTYSTFGLVTGTGQNVSGTVYYAGGGGGGPTNQGAIAGAGGNGGGAAGGGANNGLTNTGGGGGGSAASSSTNGGNGGSGVIIIRYLKA